MHERGALWIKICGLSTLEDVDAAVAAGADAVGFVFATSPREVTLDAAKRLRDRLAGRAQLVLVMRHPAPTFARLMCTQLAPRFLQTDRTDLASLSLPPGVEFLPVIRDNEPVDDPPDYVLFEGSQSGTGKTCDWTQAERLARHTKLVLAGGLSPDNVADAISTVRPYGVDVSSGVEHARGQKDPDLIHRFVTAARRAADEV